MYKGLLLILMVSTFASILTSLDANNINLSWMRLASKWGGRRGGRDISFQ